MASRERERERDETVCGGRLAQRRKIAGAAHPED